MDLSECRIVALLEIGYRRVISDFLAARGVVVLLGDDQSLVCELCLNLTVAKRFIAMFVDNRVLRSDFLPHVGLLNFRQHWLLDVVDYSLVWHNLDIACLVCTEALNHLWIDYSLLSLVLLVLVTGSRIEVLSLSLVHTLTHSTSISLLMCES